ncbi:MAG: hypothetical protein AAFO73_05190 [Pseudomonadota bacterium]
MGGNEAIFALIAGGLIGFAALVYVFKSLAKTVGGFAVLAICYTTGAVAAYAMIVNSDSLFEQSWLLATVIFWVISAAAGAAWKLHHGVRL